MDKETLSVDLDPMLIERVRRYSEAHGTEVSETIGGLIESLPSRGAGKAALGAPADNAFAAADEEEWVRDLPPLTRSLLGIASGDADVEDYREYLWRKYGP